MFLFLLFAILYAKIRGYKIKPVLKAYPLYPYAVVEVLSLFFQASIFMRNYHFVQYTHLMNSVYLYTLILPIFYYRLYKPGICGSLLMVIGTFLNKFVMSQNGGKMPVFATLSKFTKYYEEAAILSVDNIHVIGNGTTNYIFLTDYIDTGFSILSVGDLLIHSFIFIVIFSVIKEININPKYLTTKEKDAYYETL